MTPFISVIIPCRNEEHYIAKCLDSILSNNYPHTLMEILLIDGMSEDNTIAIVNNYISQYPFIHIIQNINKIAPSAMNLGIKNSQGDYIVRLDAHAKFPHNYLKTLIDAHLILEDADNIGVSCKTDVLRKTPTALSIKNVLSDPYGVGNSLFRIGLTEITEVDTVPFGCYPKRIFDEIGLFDERLIRNQDIELNKRITHNGGKIYLLPDVECTYYARETYTALAHNNYQNGYWNIMTTFYTGRLGSLSLRHFIPLSFILSLLIPLVLSPFCPLLVSISELILFLYLSIIGWRAWKIKKQTTWHHQLWAFIVLHFSYGFGSIGGIIALTKKILSRDF